MDVKDWITIPISLAAFGLSWINYRRSRLTADRQYALIFCQDVARWAGELFELFRQIEINTPWSLEPEQKRIWFRELIPKTTSLFERGALLFPGRIIYGDKIQAEHPILQIISELVALVDEHRRGIFERRGQSYINRYPELRSRLMSAVQAEIGVELRYNEALSAITPKKDAGEIVFKALQATAKPS